MKTPQLLQTMLLLCLLIGWQQTVFAQDRNPARNVIYPDGAFIQNGGRIIDVTQPPYNAIGDGVTDDTDAIVAAYNTVADSLREYGWEGSDNTASYILYFPSGTYLVSNTLIHDGEINYDTARVINNRRPEGLARLRIVGQNKTNTIIRLKDNSPGFGPGSEKVVVSFQKKNAGEREGTNIPGSNQLSDITINTGSGNPGAIGVLYITANIGEISNVKIKSEDGQGAVGLDMPFFSEQGHYRDITVEGFDHGMRVISLFATNPTLEYVTLSNQNNTGILVVDGSPCIRKLESTNLVPAIRITDDQAQVALIDSELKGGSAANPAIDWQDTVSQIFVRNAQVSGYGSAIERAGEVVVSAQVTGRVREYVSDQIYTLFEGVEEESLNLPIAESPLLSWEQDLSQWANVDDYPGANDSEKIQNAMNSGKPVVYFPQARYDLTTPVSIPASVRHVDFMYSRIGNNDQFIISEGGSQTLFLDHGLGRSILTQSAPRPVVMRNQTMNYTYTSDQPSELYLESVAGIGASSNFCPPPLTIWGRGVNNENKQTSNFKVFGGTMWVLGYKTEGPQASYEVRDGGKLEVLGGYRNEVLADEGLPIVINDSSDVSFVGYSNLNGSFEVVITETQSGITQRLLRQEVPTRPSSSVFVPLYVGRAGASAPACLVPEQISAVPGLTDVQLFWQVRNNEGNSYEVRYRPTSTATWQSATGSGNTATISALSSGTNYEWQVRFECTGGTSDWSTTGTFTTGIGAKNTPTAPTIDGALNEAEWDLTTAATKLANGTPNNTVTFGVLWDETYLYIGAEVLDDALFNDSDNVFQDDAVEVYLDINNNGGAYDFTDNQLIKGYSDTSLFISKAFNGTIHHQSVEINGGYSVELAIPWAGLDATPSEGLTIGFDIGNDDDDDGGNRDSQLVWAGNTFNFNNTSAFGDVILLDSLAGSGSANQSPYTTHTLPGIIQAEDYDQGGAEVAYTDTDSGNNGRVYRNEDVDIEVSRDTGGGYNVGWMSNGEWLEYTLSDVTAGTYDIHFRVASRNTTSNKTLTAELDGNPVGSVSIPATGGWQSWQTVTLPEVSIPGDSDQVLRLNIGGGSFNLNYVEFVAKVNTTLEAEEANLSQAVVESNHAGYTGSGFVNYNNVVGSYVEWTVDVPTAGPYQLSFRYANGSSANRPCAIRVNGTVINPGLAFNPSGAWTAYQNTATVTANLTAGQNTVRVTATGGSGGANVDHLRVVSSPSLANLRQQSIDKITDELPVQSPRQMAIYPNPADKELNVYFGGEESSEVEVTILDLAGRWVSSDELSLENQRATYQVSHLKPGIYLIRFQTSGQTVTERLIVK